MSPSTISSFLYVSMLNEKDIWNKFSKFVQDNNNSGTSYEADAGDRFERVSAFLFQGLGLNSKKNAWAGPDHWKYWRPKGWYYQGNYFISLLCCG